MDIKFLENFLKVYRPSGFEKEGADVFTIDSCKLNGVRKEFIDKMWNACVSIGSDREDALKILISGHSDQNCLIVTEITKNGFLKYATQGGISPKTVIDSDFYVITSDKKYIPCFCSYKAIHLEKPDDRKKCPEHKDLYLDLGCTSREEVEELGVQIGDLVVFNNERLMMNFGPKGDYIVGSGLDDGVACGIVYDVLSKLNEDELKEKNIRVYGACITSEETGARGVGPVVRKIQPHISIDIDVCHDSSKEIGGDEGRPSTMGCGVVLNYGPDKFRPLNDQLRTIAKDFDIPFQVIAGKAGGTNTNSIQMMSDNCATTLLSIPCRYMHSGTHEMVHKDDIGACGRLIGEFINHITPEKYI